VYCHKYVAVLINVEYARSIRTMKGLKAVLSRMFQLSQPGSFAGRV
jgi:hypothetical protein